jgi:NADH-quinone oxidoreductase subunit L
VRLFSLVFLGKPFEVSRHNLAKKKATPKGQRGNDHVTAPVHEAHHATPLSMKLPVGILAILSVVGGWIIYALHWNSSFLQPVFEGLLVEHEPINWGIAGATVGMAVLFGGLSWYLYGPNGVRRESEVDLHAKSGILVNMFYFDAIYGALIVAPIKALATYVAEIFDVKVIDGLVDGLGKLAALIGRGLRPLNSGYVRRYALTLFAGVALMLVYYVFYV